MYCTTVEAFPGQPHQIFLMPRAPVLEVLGLPFSLVGDGYKLFNQQHCKPLAFLSTSALDNCPRSTSSAGWGAPTCSKDLSADQVELNDHSDCRPLFKDFHATNCTFAPNSLHLSGSSPCQHLPPSCSQFHKETALFARAWLWPPQKFLDSGSVLALLVLSHRL